MCVNGWVELLMTSAEEIEAHRSRVALRNLDILRSRLGLDGKGNQGSRSPQLLDDSKADAIRERRKQLESGILDLVHELKDLSLRRKRSCRSPLAQLEHTDELIEKNEAKTDQISKETKAATGLLDKCFRPDFYRFCCARNDHVYSLLHALVFKEMVILFIVVLYFCIS